MKKILFAATVLCMMGCQNKPTNSTPALDPSNMDTSVAPNESFYQYATGGWQAKNPLKPEHSSYNMFNVLNDNNEIRINELFTQMTKENPAKGTVNQKIADLYKLGLDSVRLNQEGAAPIRAELETILSLDDKKQLTPILSVMQMTSSSPLFSFGPEADLKDSKVNALYIGQSGIGMGDRDYYLDAENESIREAYKTYLNRLFTLAGLEESQVSKATDAVMRIETELAKNMRSNVELRDLQRMYNPMATADLKKNYDAIDGKILQYLVRNARMPFLEIARECGISGAAIHQRIRKLHDSGVILGSRLIVDPKMLGFDVCALIGICVQDPMYMMQTMEKLKEIPEIVECHFITGNFNILVKLYCLDNEHLMKTIFDGILRIQGISTTQTFISLNEAFQRQVSIDFIRAAER